MSLMSLGVLASSLKENEFRLPLHPGHLDRIDPDVRAKIFLEEGYGERFGVGDDALRSLVGGLRSREQLLDECDVLLLPKPMHGDVTQLRQGQVLWGWPHCVQDEQMTQLAIDRQLTLIAWEAMNHWTSTGAFSVHVFHKNNELAGYCSVLHALQLSGLTGSYGRRMRAVVISFGATARGAVTGLGAMGVSDVTVLTQRAAAAVASPMPSVVMGHFAEREDDPSRLEALTGLGPVPLAEYLAGFDIIVNCIRQDTDAPLTFVTDEELAQFRPGTIFVDVSCDEGMGFEWARPTHLRGPDAPGGPRLPLLRRGPQPVAPVELGHLGDQRGAPALPAQGPERSRDLGHRRHDQERHRDPRRCRHEPEDPVLPEPAGRVPARRRRPGARR
ncbi:alanine dehydrogenase [Streptomyces aurantiacus]|uniref:alanine dehydrogenase n=1 Tax=Streptomyces aurantiacus TaxID=47760 RepID=UPI0027946629|nr:alanine dehydrogenase [Streptomyces aurantiacus]MDQ0773278.1 alanine dehydrogenase [Streptomyces aurantiacus]